MLYLIVILVVVVGAIFFVVSLYNGLVRGRNEVKRRDGVKSLFLTKDIVGSLGQASNFDLLNCQNARPNPARLLKDQFEKNRKFVY